MVHALKASDDECALLYNVDYTAEHILTTTPNQSVECKWEIVKQK